VSAARVAHVGAADGAKGHLAASLANRFERVLEPEGPCLLEPHPVLIGGTDRLALLSCGGVLENGVHLVPFELERDQGGDEVVDVRRRGDQCCNGVPAVVIPAPAAGGSLHLLPGEDVHSEHSLD